jgi:DNA-binding transcriptional ArsR family regulator
MLNSIVEDSELDRVYAALADPTRRRIMAALRAGEARITDLARSEPISFAAVARHVAVLEGAGLVSRDVRGREHWISAESSKLRPAQRWIEEQTTYWADRADALARRLGRRRSGR